MTWGRRRSELEVTYESVKDPKEKEESRTGVQRSGGVVDGVRSERQNCAVEEVKHRHPSVVVVFFFFFLAFSVEDSQRLGRTGSLEDPLVRTWASLPLTRNLIWAPFCYNITTGPIQVDYMLVLMGRGEAET